MKIAAHVINRLPQPRLGFTSPFEKLWGAKLRVGHYRVFGCVQITYVENLTRKRFVVFLSNMITGEKDGSVVILQLVGVILHEMWYLMKCLVGSLLKMSNYLIPKRLKIKYNK